jgi:hypothetical protein
MLVTAPVVRYSYSAHLIYCGRHFELMQYPGLASWSIRRVVLLSQKFNARDHPMTREGQDVGRFIFPAPIQLASLIPCACMLSYYTSCIKLMFPMETAEYSCLRQYLAASGHVVWWQEWCTKGRPVGQMIRITRLVFFTDFT